MPSCRCTYCCQFKCTNRQEYKSSTRFDDFVSLFGICECLQSDKKLFFDFEARHFLKQCIFPRTVAVGGRRRVCRRELKLSQKGSGYKGMGSI